MNKRRPPAWRKMLVMLVALAALGAVWRYTPLRDVVTVDNAVDFAHRLRRMPGAPVVVILSYVVAAVVMFPRPLLTLTTIVAFGTLWGVTYCAAGILVAALTFFYVGKFMPRQWLEKLAGDKLEGVEALFHEHGVKAIFALNMVPAPPFAVQGLIAGACEMSTLRYILGNML
ncbi:MAG TPA: VTT domain-containing protein, partial [Usitatibacter sp.]|nr:VTT domain-containing protein [Usitatibacter sp.]